MSIIYDALKKVQAFQHKSSKDTSLKQPLKPKKHIYLLYVSVVGLGVFVASIFFSLFVSRRPVNQVANIQPTIKKPQAVPITHQAVPAMQTNLSLPAEPKTPSQSVWILNGIFFSENQGYALINNRIVKEGDVIEGANVKQIGLEEVELESGGNLFKLSIGSSN